MRITETRLKRIVRGAVRQHLAEAEETGRGRAWPPGHGYPVTWDGAEEALVDLMAKLNIKEGDYSLKEDAGKWPYVIVHRGAFEIVIIYGKDKMWGVGLDYTVNINKPGYYAGNAFAMSPAPSFKSAFEDCMGKMYKYADSMKSVGV